MPRSRGAKLREAGFPPGPDFGPLLLLEEEPCGRDEGLPLPLPPAFLLNELPLPLLLNELPLPLLLNELPLPLLPNELPLPLLLNELPLPLLPNELPLPLLLNELPLPLLLNELPLPLLLCGRPDDEEEDDGAPEPAGLLKLPNRRGAGGGVDERVGRATGVSSGTSRISGGVRPSSTWRSVSFTLSTRSICFTSLRSSRVLNVEATPREPARPVRPTRWMKSSGDCGMSKFTTCAMLST